MRYVRHPDNITVLKQDGQVDPNAGSFPFLTFLEIIVFDDRRGTATYKSIVRWKAMIELFRASRVGDVIALEDQDWEIVEKILQAPERHFPAYMTIQLLPFFEAVIAAPAEKPAT